MGFSALLDEQNKDVGRKLGLATALMFTLPIATFYIALHYVFRNKPEPTNWAGGAAVLVTNIIVFAYVWTAFSEPEEKEPDRGGNNNKEPPRVGRFMQESPQQKLRTD